MIRFGIVGAGGIAHKFARDLKYVKNAELTAVSARSLESAKSHQTYFGCTYAFGSYEEMAKSDVIDAVYIATPHRFHKEHAILFMKNKKHVLVEKPAAVNATEFEEMVHIAKENKVLLMEAMWTHFLPATRYIIDQMNTHEFGDLKRVKINFGFFLSPTKSPDGRLLNPELAGGSLLDLGIYPVSFVFLLSKTPLTLHSTKAIFTKTGVDRSGKITLSDEHGVSYVLKHDMAKDIGNEATLQFEHAKIVMKEFHGCHKIIINHHMMDIPLEGEGFVHEIRAFVDDLLHQRLENTIMNYDKVLKTLTLMDEIRTRIGLKFPFEN